MFPGSSSRGVTARNGASGEPALIGELLTAALEKENWPHVVSLVRRHWAVAVSDHWHLMLRVFRELPPDVLAGDLALKVGAVAFTALGAELVSFPDPLPVDPEALAEIGRSDAAFDRLAVGTTQAMILRVGGRFAEASELCVRLQDLGSVAVAAQAETVGSAMAILHLQWAVTHLLAGSMALADDNFRRACRRAEFVGIDFVARNAAGARALGYALAGDVLKATEWIERESRYGEAPAWIAPRVRVAGLVAAALTAVERADADGARLALDELGEIQDTEELWAFVTYAHCQLALLSGNPVAGLDRIERETSIRARWFTGDSVARGLLGAVVIDLHCAAGNTDPARVVPPVGDGLLEKLARARLLQLAGESADALAAATRLTAGPGTPPRVLLEALLITVTAAVELGRYDVAESALQRALSLAEMSGAVRPFLTLLPAARDWVVAGGHRVRLAALGVDLCTAPTVFRASVRTVHLTDRELEVLHELASRRRVADIAARMFVSLNTLKSHMRSLYRKLGVNSRDDALETAASLGLLWSAEEKV